MTELIALANHGSLKVISIQEVSPNANILEGRFVFAIKIEGTKDEIWKTRFVVQGYWDKLKILLVHNSGTVGQYSVKILVALAFTLNLRIF